MLAMPHRRCSVGGWLWPPAPPTLLLILAASMHVAVASATLFCPLPGSLFSIDLSSFAGSAAASLSLSTSPPPEYDGDASSFLCLLSLRTPSPSAGGSYVRKPVARAYAGREWEVQGGPFVGIIEAPSCDNLDGTYGVCTVEVPVDDETLDRGKNEYILTSYSRVVDARTEAARFLEQSTFGSTLSDINVLSSTGNTPDFASWIEHQMDPNPVSGAGMSAHREFFRRHVNPRFEYPFRGGAQGNTTACDITSRWRKFALTERDGVVSMQTNQNKVFYIKYDGNSNRYIWFVEGLARTTTATLGKVYDVDKNFLSYLEAGVAYKISSGKYDNDIQKYSCVGCPVRICKMTDSFCGYLENPRLDVTGIEGTDTMPYTVVDLPDHNTADNRDMVPIDDGPYMLVLDQWQKAGDEFWLNSTVDLSQCANHDSPQQPQPSGLDPDAFGIGAYEHMESALPTVFGRSKNANTGEVETLAFDPIFRWYDNTVEEPIPDGGGATYTNTDGWFEGLGWWYNGDFDEPVQDGRVHCANVKRTFQNEDGCRLSFDPYACRLENGETVFGNGDAVVVCGSPGEVSSDFTNGVINGFDVKSWIERSARREIYKDATFTEQKYNIWTKLALTAPDQLRQRVAWALYQIVPIGAKGGFEPRTETWTVYYDIFVRHAFGNYRNVLKEVSFHALMSKWLSFHGNAAIQYELDKDPNSKIYPDENYAREIMQLFSIGLFQLNMDGTIQTDADGNSLYTYNSDDIMSYARAWTGFEKQDCCRGNVEEKDGETTFDRVDPLIIKREKRDVFPKSDLQGGYIGDGYPLCADLPAHSHLRKGATYLVLGSQSNPEGQHDDPAWEGDGSVARLELNPDSPLYAKLCAPDASGTCTFPGKVVLDENLDYSDPTYSDTFPEYNVDTVRTVRVQSSPVEVYFEYVQSPCVHQNFFEGGREVIAENNRMCADPRVAHAAASCCSVSGGCTYDGERVKFDTAKMEGFASDGCIATGVYAWTGAECIIRAKISVETGQVARVDHTDATPSNLVHDDSINFFKVAWTNKEGLPTDIASCTDPLCYSVADGCVCDTFVTEAPGFSTVADIGSKEDILASLHIGAVDPTVFDVGTYNYLGECLPGVEVYAKFSATCGDALGTDAVFKLTNSNGIERFLKNMISTVTIADKWSFRNPVHFIDFLDRNVRDMYHETDAVIDSYFYHPSHAPFLALRFLQRFGISNPSPAYIERVSTAYKAGSYVERFGSGNYGDLGAMIAAILLDPEARSASLDADPSHGHIREPFIKIMSLLRSMEAFYHAPLNVPMMDGPDQVHHLGQGPYRSLSVFSFFLPEFIPSGALGDAGLVAPEAQLLKSNFIINLLDGMYSTVKFGLSNCHHGFMDANWGAVCPKNEGNIALDAIAELMYQVDSGYSIDDVLDELSLILTSSRLGDANRATIKGAMETVYNSGDTAKSVRIAAQLLISSPEFHSTSLARKTGIPKQLSGYTTDPVEPYKAVVFYMMNGGADSFNILVPKADCQNGRNLYNEYAIARGVNTLTSNELLDINASSSGQVCNTFAVNSEFPLLRDLYGEQQALFLANTGVLNKPLTKRDDYVTESKVQLFAHNHMRAESYYVDTQKEIAGTGVGGRLLDMLGRQGFHTSANSLGPETLVKGTALDNNPIWTVPVDDPEVFDQHSSVGAEMIDVIKLLNGLGDEDDSLLGETWSSKSSQALFEYEKSVEFAELFGTSEFSMDNYKTGSDVNNRFRAAAQYMKMRTVRKVNREVFIISHDGFDSHSEQKAEVNTRFSTANEALTRFVDEMKAQGIWENVVIVMGSEFGRSISPNSNGGTDHAWGGNYFVIGGGVNGGKILGQYPEHFSSLSDQWLSRGRIIPTTPWESVWHGIAQWMGVQSNEDLAAVLPNMDNFRQCDMFTDQDLFVNGQVPSYDCATMDSDGDGVLDEFDLCPDTPSEFALLVDESGCPSGSLAPSTSPVPSAAPTVTPSETPTLSFAPTGLGPNLVNKGEGLTDYQDCEGNCDDDDDCFGELVCFQSNVEGGSIPGCSGLTEGTTNYCFRPTVHTGYLPLTFIGDELTSYGECEGDCDSDSDCNGDLVCFQRGRGTSLSIVPNCDGTGIPGEDYCYNPLATAPAPTDYPTLQPTSAPVIAATPAPTHDPTPQPSKAPTDDPTLQPTSAPVIAATPAPTHDPTPQPSKAPTDDPTLQPTSAPVIAATPAPTPAPSGLPPTGDLVKVNSVIRGSATTTVNGAIGCTKGTDGTTNKCTIKKSSYPENDNVPYFVATPATRSVVKGIRVYTANNYKGVRDPTSYILEGRNDVNEEWNLISEGAFNLGRHRNPLDIYINSTYADGDPNRRFFQEWFLNDVEYSQYRVSIPSVESSKEDSASFAEIELPGLMYSVPMPADCATTGMSCSHSSACCSGICLGDQTCEAAIIA